MTDDDLYWFAIDLFNGILTGTMLGGYYALISVGLALNFGVMKLVSLSHGDWLIVAAYLCVTLITATGMAPFWSPLVVVPIMYVIGYFVPRGLMGVIQDLRQPHLRRRQASPLAQWRRWLLGTSAAQNRAALTEQPGVVAAYWLPASPLLALSPSAPHAELMAGMERVRRDLEALAPDTLVVYSTRWYAVLDQLWQGKPRISGLHVDENWHELGELRYDITTDVSLARACVRSAKRADIASKLVNYTGFPLDSATLATNQLLNPDGQWPTLIVANNLYHDFERTRALGEIVAEQADAQGKRVAVLVLGGLSGTEFRDDRDLADDAIASVGDDEANRRLLKTLQARDLDALYRQLPDFVAQARGDMGLKHLAFALGALHGRLGKVEVYGYGPQYGAGAAVVKLL